MITVKYEKGQCRLSVSGHAGAGEKGRDIVCAAVSALVLTLGENIRVLRDTGSLRRYTVDVKEGSALLECQPVAGMETVVRCVFEAVCCGFALVQELYPQFVRYSSSTIVKIRRGGQ